MSEHIAEVPAEQLPDSKVALKSLKQTVAPSVDLARNIVAEKAEVTDRVRTQLAALRQTFTPSQLAQISALEAQTA